ncbi:hypothetical protein [Natronosalvus amylolyticus]|uniref:Cap15 family cyclic dinucleotide receptor domain-containing protein n=1 Tax=Natronosalvus amylolyticus TaxID=2961994 RepID=UPI003CCDF963
MHSYSIDGSRPKISGFIMLAAIVIANLVNYLLSIIDGRVPFTVESVSASVFLSFSILLWVFNNYLWKWPITRRFSGVPNIEGQWVGPLDSSYNSSNGNGPMRPTFTIHQKWSEIEVDGDFSKSISESTSASFVTDKGRPQLIFTYRNYPRDSSSNRRSHEGTNTLRYMTDSSGNELLQGEYYTDQERNNHGTMELRRAEEVDDCFKDE